MSSGYRPSSHPQTELGLRNIFLFIVSVDRKKNLKFCFHLLHYYFNSFYKYKLRNITYNSYKIDKSIEI